MPVQLDGALGQIKRQFQAGEGTVQCEGLGQLAEAFALDGPFTSLKLPFDLPQSTIKLHWHRRFHEDPGNVWLRELIVRLFGV